MGIDWNRFKSYKEHAAHKEGATNLDILVAFLKNVEGLYLYDDIYETIASDDVGRAMLNKNSISNADELMKLYFRST